MESETIPPKPHAESAFKQQKLTSYHPQHAASTVSLSLLAVAIIFIPIGAAIVVSSDALTEVDVRYDHIKKCTYQSGGDYTLAFNSTTLRYGCNCKQVVTLTKTISAPVYIYYRLKDFHQNYRQYQASRDDAQLQGGSEAPISDCSPFRFPGEWGKVRGNADGTPYSAFQYNPCGAIAWSMFNDSISLYKITNPPINVSDPSPPSTANVQTVCRGDRFDGAGNSLDPANQCSKSGIALTADKDTRFKAAATSATTWSNGGSATSADPFLKDGFYAFEAGHKVPLATDEDFMVWSRTASMPDFLKLYRVINVDLVAGDYLFDIEEHFDVTSFSGEKHVVLATRNWIGGKNYVLGVSLIVMGCLSFILAVATLVLRFTSALAM